MSALKEAAVRYKLFASSSSGAEQVSAALQCLGIPMLA